MRNDSPVAHGFDGITHEEVIDAVTGAAKEYLPDILPATPDASMVTGLARDLVAAVGFTAVPRATTSCGSVTTLPRHWRSST